MKLKDFEIERFEHNGFTCVIYRDPEPPNPREWDNLATLACWHRRANLGDKQIEGMTFKQVVKMVRDDGDKILALLPLMLYEHSGMTMWTGDRPRGWPYNCRWDSGQVGWGYVTKKQAEKMGCILGQKYEMTRQKRDADGNLTDEREVIRTGVYDREFFEDAIRAEVKAYDDYLTGACYGYEVLDEDGDHIDSCEDGDHIDSCWGFYVSDPEDPEGDGGIEYVRQQARDAAESHKPIGWTPSACNVSCE